MAGDALGPAHWRAVYDAANGWRKSRATGKMHNEKQLRRSPVPPGSHGALAGIATERPGTRHLGASDVLSGLSG